MRARQLAWAAVLLVACTEGGESTASDDGLTSLGMSGTTVGPGTASASASDSTSDSTATATSTATDGSTSASSADSTTSLGGSDGPPIFDLGIPDAPAEECLECEIALMTTQSNAFVPMGMPLLAEAMLDTNVVFGLGEAGAGRFAVSGDGNVIYREGTCPLWEWLGATGKQPPRVLCIGADWPCSGETGGMPPLEINHLHMYPGQLDYGGLTLPPAYEGNAAALHADYDVVAYFAVIDFASGGWDFDPGDVATIESFVRDEGGGAYFIGEYWNGGMGPPQLDSLNPMVAPYGLSFEQLSLAWGPAGAAVELDCFPAPAG